MTSSKNVSPKRLRPAASRLGLWQRRLLYSSYAILFISGIPGMLHWDAAQAIAMRFHGAAAMAFLLVLGSLVKHVQVGWAARSNRRSGVGLLAFFGILIITGWLLYYGSDGLARDTGRSAHLILGALSPLLLALHILITPRKGKA